MPKKKNKRNKKNLTKQEDTPLWQKQGSTCKEGKGQLI